MSIDAKTNGLHSFAEALRSFNNYHSDPDDVFALKDCILRSNHALEILFKNKLYETNPFLLVPDDTKVSNVLDAYINVFEGENLTIFDNELKTISLRNTLENFD